MYQGLGGSMCLPCTGAWVWSPVLGKKTPPTTIKSVLNADRGTDRHGEGEMSVGNSAASTRVGHTHTPASHQTTTTKTNTQGNPER